MSVIGVDQLTGKPIEGLQHLRQSVRDILTTPKGTRVMRRDYGSDLFELIDANITPLTLVQIYAATADALRIWEPRLKVTRVQAVPVVSEIETGKITIDLDATFLPDGREIRLEGLVV